VGALFVAPGGKDDNAGTSTTQAFRTVQRALQVAEPGTTISRLPARTWVTSARSGGARRITIQGPTSGPPAVIYGTHYAVPITNSDYTLQDLTIDGEPSLLFGACPTDSVAAIPFKTTHRHSIVNSKLISSTDLPGARG
jgi:hypothetical protein